MIFTSSLGLAGDADTSVTTDINETPLFHNKRSDSKERLAAERLGRPRKK